MVSLPRSATILQIALGILVSIWRTGGQGSRLAPRTIKIGGLFEHEFEGQELAFKHAVEKVNARRDLLPHIKLLYDIQQSPAQDSFTASKKVCRQMRDGVAAIFGPMSSLPAAHVQSICDAMEIPHVETRWDYNDNQDFFSINLYPHYVNLTRAFIDYIVFSEWDSFTILYENNDGLLRLQEILKAPSDKPFIITVRKLRELPDGSGDYRPVLKEIRNKSPSRIILDCDYKKVHTILHQAMTINMTTQYHHYLLTTLDSGLVDLEDFKYNGANITAFRLINPVSPEVIDVRNDWDFQRKLTGRSPLENNLGFRTETALVYDAVHLFAKALDELSRAQDVQTSNLSCNKAKPWGDGSSLINYMKMTVIDGITGPVELDHHGRRTRFNLELVKLSMDGLQKIGTWDPVHELNITIEHSKAVEAVQDSLKNKTLIITTINEPPYIMLVHDPEGKLKGNARYEGYCVDLINEIASILHFNYTIKEVGDGKYGSKTGADQEWNGMVRELMDQKADLAVASLTISYIREQVIDFTKPFMNLGISILYKRPEKKTPSLFSFMSPLSYQIWIYVLAAYLLVSFMLFVLARFSPYEWYNPHPCNPDSDVVENQFTLLNSLWFSIGSLMQQGSEVSPRAMSTRLVSGIWWFFTLIIISSYTANLAAFLTVERMSSPVENADDLAKQTEIKYGSVWSGSTMSFFKSSKIPTYKRMWDFMVATKPSAFVNSTKEGVERVKKGKYAYLLESTMNEYNVERHCDLMRIGGLLDSKGYGIGTPMGSPIRDLISDAILKLQEDQVLQQMYNKWWKEKSGGGQCLSDDKKDANALAIDSVGGIFMVLLFGLVLALFVGVLEFIYKANKDAEEDKVRRSLCSELMDELRFAVRCGGSSTKPAKKRKRAQSHENMLDGNGMALTVPLTGYNYPNHSGMSSGREAYT